MAAIVVSHVDAYCARLEQYSPRALVAMGLDGTGLAPNSTETALGLTASKIAEQALELGTKGYVTLRVQGTTDTNTADSVAIDFGDRGVTFADATFRRIEALASIADADGMGFERAQCVADGGSTVIATVAQALTSTAVLADDLSGGLSATHGLTFALNGAADAVELNAIGASGVDARWDIECRVYPATALAYFAG